MQLQLLIVAGHQCHLLIRMMASPQYLQWLIESFSLKTAGPPTAWMDYKDFCEGASIGMASFALILRSMLISCIYIDFCSFGRHPFNHIKYSIAPTIVTILEGDSARIALGTMHMKVSSFQVVPHCTCKVAWSQCNTF